MRRRTTQAASGSSLIRPICVIYAPDPKKLACRRITPRHGTWSGRASRATGHREQLVHSGIAKDVMDVRIDVDQTDARTRRDQPLVGLQEHAEAGAGDVFESARIDHAGWRDFVQKRLRRGRLGCIQPPDQHYVAVFSVADVKHGPAPSSW